ncbi:MAG TPA: Rne/Rng family ribonuclease [Stellaceae bacterium]|jgi:ribonuclease E
MAKRMLVDAAHPEETRVVVLNGQRLEEFDFETSTKKQIKGNIYLAKVTRVEPSLQAAFVEYGGNRHGFLAFGEIHPDYYRIPVADRQAALDADRAFEEAANEREDESVEAGLPIENEHAIHDPDDEHGGPHDDEHGETDHDHADIMATAMGEDRLVNALVPDPEASEGEDDHLDADTSAFPEDPEAPASADLRIEEPDDSASTPPEGETFAHDDGGHSDEARSESLDTADHVPSAEGTPPLEVIAEAPVTIETIGGDEDGMEETVRPRARPHRHYKIQEVIKRRQIMLVQVTKEERGNKGAALTTYISLAGRYCVLMPNTPRGGGVSRKITSMQDRRRLKDLMSDLEVPDGMGVIVRTAGSERSKPEITRDFEYLIRLWDEIRELTLKSTAPALIYEEGNLIKRSIRDLYARDIDEVLVDGREGYDTAKSFMRMLMPSHSRRVKLYNDPSVPLFHRFQVEGQLDLIHSPVVQLRSGGYIVINPTEALVAIDVNSGRSTRERNIEETALKTNLEAAEEVARQLRLRDLAGLIVIDFIDMEEHRHNAAVERRLKDSMRHDRARIQIGRISPFGLLELSRQRLRPSLLEASTQPCPHCNGTGHIRSTESTALHLLRAIEEEGMRRRTAEIKVAVASAVALYVLNHKRATLQQIEGRYGCHVTIDEDETLIPPAFRLDRTRAFTPAELAALPVLAPVPVPVEEDPEVDESLDEAAIDAAAEEFAGGSRRSEGEHSDPSSWLPQGEDEEEAETLDAGRDEQAGNDGQHGDGQGRRRRRRRRRGRPGDRDRTHDHGAPAATEGEGTPAPLDVADTSPDIAAGDEIGESEGSGESELSGDTQPAKLQGEGDDDRRRRRRGRRGGRRRRRGQGQEGQDGQAPEQPYEAEVRPRIQLELRPGEPGYSGPAEEFGEESDLIAAEEVAEADVIETVPPSDDAARHATRPTAEHTAPPPAKETMPAAAAASEAEGETERAPVAYNVSPPHEVSGPTPNPRRGWWRR